MNRIPALTNEAISPALLETLQTVEKRLGRIPNMMRSMAHAPGVVKAYLSAHSALAAGKLTPVARELLAILAAQTNRCDYCLRAHVAAARKLGVADSEIILARAADSSHAPTAAMLRFAQQLLLSRGTLGDRDFASLSEAGFDLEHVAEIIAVTAIQVYANYYNRVSEIAEDFPEVQPNAEAFAREQPNPAEVRVIKVPGKIAAVAEKVRDQIKNADLWVLHEIDVQATVARADLKIRPMRQILYFHPRYMARLLALDERAGYAAPLKFTLCESNDGAATEIICMRPSIQFAPFPCTREVADELDQVFDALIDRLK
jgi:uncharacterized peroxidase-related enzyme